MGSSIIRSDYSVIMHFSVSARLGLIASDPVELYPEIAARNLIECLLQGHISQPGASGDLMAFCISTCYPSFNSR